VYRIDIDEKIVVFLQKNNEQSINSKIMRMVKIVIILILGALVLSFYGCTFTNSKPYSAKRTAAILSKYYDTKIEVVAEGSVKEPPFAMNRYLMRDKILGFEFVVEVAVKETFVPFFAGMYINNNYQTAVMLFYSKQAQALAQNYGVKLVTVENIQQEPQDKLYLYKSEQLVEASKLYFELRALYGFDKLRKPNTYNIYNEPEFLIFYLPEDNSNLDEAVSIYWLAGDGWNYIHYKEPDWSSPYQNEETFFNNISMWWNDALREGKLSFKQKGT